MSYTIVWEATALADIRRLRPVDPSGALACAAAVRGLCDAPEPENATSLGGTGFHRLRVGAWRVLYYVEKAENTVYVDHVGRSL